MQRSKRWRPHPGWWMALVVLVLNDHALKGAGVLPSIITGKLSDFAGLLVAPTVVCAIITLVLGVRNAWRSTHPFSRIAWGVSHVAVGGLFTLINLVADMARLYGATAARLGVRAQTYVDPTDLIALPMLWLSYRMFFRGGAKPPWNPSEPSRAPGVSRGARIGLAAALVACLATSRAASPRTPDPSRADHSMVDVYIVPDEDVGEIIVSARPLLEDPDGTRCEQILAGHTEGLTLAMFAPESSFSAEPSSVPGAPKRSQWIQGPWERVGLWLPSDRPFERTCYAALVHAVEAHWLGIDEDESLWHLLAWRADEVPIVSMPDGPDVPSPLDAGAVVVRFHAEDGLELRAQGPVRVSIAPASLRLMQ